MPLNNKQRAAVTKVAGIEQDTDEWEALELSGGKIRTILEDEVDVVVTNVVEVEEFSPTSLSGGVKTITSAATPEALVASSTPCKWVALAPLTTNTGEIYFGTGATPVFPLAAGYSVPIANAAYLNIKAAVDGEGVYYLIGVV